MTEIPEHLLRRSKERRDALGLGGGGGASEAAPADAPPAAAAAASQPSAAVAPAPAAPPAPVAAPPPPPPPFVTAALDRRKIPFWAVPVLAVLPVWGFVYAGSLAVPEAGLSDPVLLLGEDVYANCSGCHGVNGEGGQGRPLSDGDVLLTFPDIDDHIAWVTEGSALVGGAGNPYGDPDRPGGQRISGSEGYGQMAGFGALSEEEILAVVRYEREVLSGGAAEGGAGEGEGEAAESEAAEGEGGAEGDGAGGAAGDGGGTTEDGGAAANADGAAEDTGSGSEDGGGATDGGGDGGDATEGDG